MCLEKWPIFFLFFIILSSGCIDTSRPVVGSPNVDLSSPYQINPSKLGFFIDSSITVPINHTGDYEVKIEILQSNQIVNYENGGKEIINGIGNTITLSPHENGSLTIHFNQIPVKYELKSNPLRLHPLIKSYKTYVKYKATGTMIYGLISQSEEGEYEEIIELEDKEIDINQFIGEIENGGS